MSRHIYCFLFGFFTPRRGNKYATLESMKNSENENVLLPTIAFGWWYFVSQVLNKNIKVIFASLAVSLVVVGLNSKTITQLALAINFFLLYHLYRDIRKLNQFHKLSKASPLTPNSHKVELQVELGKQKQNFHYNPDKTKEIHQLKTTSAFWQNFNSLTWIRS